MHKCFTEFRPDSVLLPESFLHFPFGAANAVSPESIIRIISCINISFNYMPSRHSRQSIIPEHKNTGIVDSVNDADCRDDRLVSCLNSSIFSVGCVGTNSINNIHSFGHMSEGSIQTIEMQTVFLYNEKL